MSTYNDAVMHWLCIDRLVDPMYIESLVMTDTHPYGMLYNIVRRKLHVINALEEHDAIWFVTHIDVKYDSFPCSIMAQKVMNP